MFLKHCFMFSTTRKQEKHFSVNCPPPPFPEKLRCCDKMMDNCSFLSSATNGEISSDLYRFVQCDIKKCAFDSLTLEQNPQNCD